MKPLKRKSMCLDCTDNFYNGLNPQGIKECWNYKDAKIIKRKQIHIYDSPPWNHEAQYHMSCKRVKDHVFIDKDQTK